MAFDTAEIHPLPREGCLLVAQSVIDPLRLPCDGTRHPRAWWDSIRWILRIDERPGSGTIEYPGMVAEAIDVRGRYFYQSGDRRIAAPRDFFRRLDDISPRRASGSIGYEEWYRKKGRLVIEADENPG